MHTITQDTGPLAETRVGPDDWTEVLALAHGPQIVVGGPGTGKTEFLVRRLIHLVEELAVAPDRILTLSSSRQGVEDLRTRIRGSLDRTVGKLEIATFHSFAARVEEWHRAPTTSSGAPQVLTAPEQLALVHEMLAGERPEHWPITLRPLLGSRTLTAEVADFVLRVGEQRIGDDELARLAAHRAEWRALPAFLRRYRRALAERHRVDYGGLISGAIARLENEDTSPRIDYVLVDEYQDTTTAQVDLVAAVGGPGGNITVAGDPYQSIFGFRGAAPTNVASFADRFGTRAEPAARIGLTTSFRTPRRILEAAGRLTTEPQLPGATGPVTPAPGDGRVDVYVFDQQTAEAEWLADEIQRLHLADRVPLASIGVFVRSKRHLLPELSRALERRGIAYEDPDARLADQPAVRFVFDVVRAATGCDGPEETDRAMQRILLGRPISLPAGELRGLQERMRTERIAWPAACIAVPGAATLAPLLADAAWAAAAPASEGFWRIWSSLPGRGRIAREPGRSAERAAWTSLGQVLSRWNDRNPHATLLDYCRVVEGEEVEANPLLSYRAPGEDRVTLTTLHQSKGLECDVVFIADAVDGVFPDLRPRDSFLGTRHLLPHVPTATSDYTAYRLQEERRLAYTAMGRARRRVVWTATAPGGDAAGTRPSRFLAAIADSRDVTVTLPPSSEQPVTRREAEALLRRLVADPGESPVRRLAALSALTRGQRWGLRHPARFSGVRERGPDHGVHEPGGALSPSRAAAYEDCPRRFALERQLNIGNQPSIHAEFGTLIHDVLERVERAAAGLGQRHGSAAAAHDAFDDALVDGRFGGGAFAQAWRARGHELLDHLYTAWPSRGSALALEQKLDMDIDGQRWTGRVDRIERAGDEITIVDYKTGRSAASREAAATSLQLGYYLLALEAGDGLRTESGTASAEMWFPATRSRTVTVRAFDRGNLADMPRRLSGIAAGIRSEDWRAVPNEGCGRCPVRLVCPSRPEGGEAYS